MAVNRISLDFFKSYDTGDPHYENLNEFLQRELIENLDRDISMNKLYFN